MRRLRRKGAVAKVDHALPGGEKHSARRRGRKRRELRKPRHFFKRHPPPRRDEQVDQTPRVDHLRIGLFKIHLVRIEFVYENICFVYSEDAVELNHDRKGKSVEIEHSRQKQSKKKMKSHKEILSQQNIPTAQGKNRGRYLQLGNFCA